jgi:hypothetical protein
MNDGVAIRIATYKEFVVGDVIMNAVFALHITK